MTTASIVNLCKRVRSTWPRLEKSPVVESQLSQVSLFRSYFPLLRSVPFKQACVPRTFHSGEKSREAVHTHQCSLDAKHYHLMIHGTAIARQLLSKKQITSYNPRERQVANFHLQRLKWFETCLKYRFIVQVNLDETIPNYETQQKDFTERQFLITRIVDFHIN